MGWAMANHLRSELVLDAQRAVLEIRTRPDVPPAALRAENLANLALRCPIMGARS